MSLINKLFGSSTDTNEAKQINWIPLNNVDQVSQIINESKAKTQVIFKHSTSCGISHMVMNRFTRDYELPEEAIDIYYLDLLKYRDVSNEVARAFQVTHQSPQLLIVKNGTVVAHTSHHEINQIALEEYV